MQNMFNGATKFNGNISKWDVSKVTNMYNMFNGATKFNGNISSWDVSKVTNMYNMFNRASVFNGNISSWDVSKVTNMLGMFEDATAFNGDISGWDTSKVTNMRYMFSGAGAFNGNISTWDVSSVTYMESMFNGAGAFNGNLSSWDVSSVTGMGSMFTEAYSFNGNISTWDVSSVTGMNCMFCYAYSFNSDISSWDVSKVTNMGYMFYDADAFNQNLGLWYVTLDGSTLRTGNLTVGNITAQNSILQGQSPRYILTSGTGDTDNSLFQISGNTLSIKQVPAKSEYSIRIGVSGSGIFGENNAAVQRIITDTTKPTIISAIYKTGTGELTITFSEPLNSTTHDTSKIHIRNTGQSSGGVTLSNSIITNNGTNSITFDLSSTDTTTVNSMATPQLDIEQGAVRDQSGNQISAAADQTITVNDTTKPTILSAIYKTGNGILNITFSEPLNSTTHDTSKIHIRNTGQSSGGVTLSNSIITNNGTNSITFDLSSTDTTTVNSMATPQLDIEQGAVRDQSGNQISAAADQTITVNDTTKPTILSAIYKTGNGILNITFSEPLNSTTHDTSKIHIRNTGQSSGGVTLSNSIITNNGTNSITFDLSSTDTTTVNSMATPQLDIEQGAVRDQSGNLISAIADQTITVRDTVKPTFISAIYKTGNGELTITFSEPLNTATHNTTKIHIRNATQSTGGVTLSNDIITANGTDSITFNLNNTDTATVNSMVTPQIDIDAGAVRDTTGNKIATAADQSVTVHDTNAFVTTWNVTTASPSVTIPGTGTYTVNWGDGTTTSETGSATHTYAAAGSYNVTISGDLTRINLGSSTTNAQKLTNIIQWGNMSWSSMAESFRGASKMAYNATDTPDLSKVTNMSSMFGGATSFNGNISSWDVSKVTDMTDMFRNAHVFNGNISSWDVSKVTDMSSMFWNTYAFNGDLSSWDVSSVTDMTDMFSADLDRVYAFNGNISSWDVSSVTDMGGMFFGATAFNQNISSWDVSSVTDMAFMFSGATSFNGDLSSWDVSSVTDMTYMFYGASSFNGNISSWDVSSVTDMTYMFWAATSFNGNISSWDVSSVTDMSYMFNYASSFNGNISTWDVSSVTNMNNMFNGATNFNQNLGPWYVTLDDDTLKTGNLTVGNITAQNSYLQGQSRTYTLVNGTGDTDNSLFQINGSVLSIKQAPAKSEYSIRIGVNGSGLFGENNAVVSRITATDNIKPTFSSAVYKTGNGELTITFSEPLNTTAHNTTKIHVWNTGQNSRGVTLSNDIITTNGTNSITFNLGQIDTNTVNAMTTPQISIDAGAVRDTTGNQIDAASNQPIIIQDTTKPTFVSAVYKTGNGELTITFSEPLNTATHNTSKIHVRDTGQNSRGVTLSNDIITTNGTDSITFDLNDTDTTTVNGMATPQISIDAGAVRDTTGNQIDAASNQPIIIQDTTKPTFVSAVYKTGNGELTITFSEPLNTATHNTTKIHIRNATQSTGGITLSNNMITNNGTDSITFDLNNTDTTTVNGMAIPQLDIEQGAVHDISGNAIAASSNLPISVTHPPQLQLQPQPQPTPTFSLPPPQPPADPPAPEEKEFSVELHDGETLTGNVTLKDIDTDVPASISLVKPDGEPVASGLKYITLTPSGFVPNATLNLEISHKPIGDVPELPSTPYLFFDVNLPDADFSDPANFTETGLPRIKFTVPTNIDMPERFADGCPVVSVFLFEDNNWTQLGHPRIGENRIYVTNTLNHSVAILDITNNEIEKSIDIGTAPGGTALNTQTGLLYISNTNSSSITAVNVTDHTTTAIQVGAMPSGGIMVDETNNSIYVVQAGNITIINGSNNEISGSIDIPKTSREGISFDFAGMRGYVGDSANGTIHVINLTTNAVTDKIDIGGSPAAIDIDTDTNIVYSSVPSLGAVVAINATNNTVIHIIPAGHSPSGLVFNPNNNRVYVGDTPSNTTLVIDTHTHTVVREIPLGHVPHEIDIIQATNTLYVTSSESGDIIVIDGDTDDILGSIKAGAGSYAIAVNPDVSNPIRVPLADTIHEDNIMECAYTAGLPHLSKFAIGGIKPASTPTVGGATDTEPPIFDDTADEHVNINGDAFHMEHFETRTGTQTFEVGDTISMTFIVTEQGGADDLVHFEFLTNLIGDTRDYDSSDTHIQYDISGVQVTDPNGYFASTSIDISDDGADTVYITVDITFAEPMASSDIILHMWDEQENPLTVSIPDMIEIAE